MIRTKMAKRVLTRAEQKHLTKSGIHSMAAMKRQIDFMLKAKVKDPWIICPQCFGIGKKIGLLGKV